MVSDKIFKALTKHKKDKHGHRVECVKGLWGVIAPTKEEAEREAKRYFPLYLGDGEYDDLIEDATRKDIDASLEGGKLEISMEMPIRTIRADK